MNSLFYNVHFLGNCTYWCLPLTNAIADVVPKLSKKSRSRSTYRLQRSRRKFKVDARHCCSEEKPVDAAVHDEVTRDVGIQSSRRVVLCLLGAASLSLGGCDAASADFSPGFSGMRDWLKGQKQKTASFLLAPINASRDRLSSTRQIVTAEYVSSGLFEEAGDLVKVAARDCMPLESGSILELQSQAGVEVCTFKLILKNAASLLDNADPTKLRAEESLNNLIRSFVTLDKLLALGASGGSLDRLALQNALGETSVALDRFEGGIRACLGIP